MKIQNASLGCILFVLFLGACASNTAPVKQQEYARLRNEKLFEYELPVVWKAVEKVFREHVVKNKAPSDLRKATELVLETDWTYSESRDKYVEYKVNDTPRKKYLQIRFKQKVIATRALGGTRVRVELIEEIEKLKTDGSSDGYTSTNSVDQSRANETLEKINLALLSAAP